MSEHFKLMSLHAYFTTFLLLVNSIVACEVCTYVHLYIHMYVRTYIFIPCIDVTILQTDVCLDGTVCLSANLHSLLLLSLLSQTQLGGVPAICTCTNLGREGGRERERVSERQQSWLHAPNHGSRNASRVPLNDPFKSTGYE